MNKKGRPVRLYEKREARVMISMPDFLAIRKVVDANHRYESMSHFIRVAIDRLLKDESK